jgi:hypothetical protein
VRVVDITVASMGPFPEPARREDHIERGLRESVLGLIAPVTQEMALCYVAEQALGLPKSY